MNPKPNLKMTRAEYADQGIHSTERLEMKPLTMGYIERWADFLTDSRTNSYFPEEARSAPYAEVWVKRQMKRYMTKDFGLLAIHLRSTGEFIGQSGLLAQQLEGKELLEVGYHLFPEYWGHGYATESARYFKKLAFDNNLTSKLYSMIHTQNVPSQKVASANGMTNEREIRYMDLPIYLYSTEK